MVKNETYRLHFQRSLLDKKGITDTTPVSAGDFLVSSTYSSTLPSGFFSATVDEATDIITITSANKETTGKITFYAKDNGTTKAQTVEIKSTSPVVTALPSLTAKSMPPASTSISSLIWMTLRLTARQATTICM
jgi:hypothetical protein